MGAVDNAPIVTVHSRAELRDWLAAHNAEPGPVWLACYRKRHPDHLSAEDSTESFCAGAGSTAFRANWTPTAR